MANQAKVDRDKRTAGRLAHLRNARFVTEGFKSNEPTPNTAEARKMIVANKRLIASQNPQPSVRG